MNKEDLKKLGIEDEELAQKVIILHGQDIEKLKANHEAAKSEAVGLKKQLEEAGLTIEGFKKMDVDGIRRGADEWKAKAEQASKDAEAQIRQLKFDHALDGAIKEAKAKNSKAVKALLNTETLSIAEDESIAGLKEQLDKIKSEAEYLFESDQPTPKIVVGGNNKTVINDSMVTAARKAAGLPVE